MGDMFRRGGLLILSVALAALTFTACSETEPPASSDNGITTTQTTVFAESDRSTAEETRITSSPEPQTAASTAGSTTKKQTTTTKKPATTAQKTTTTAKKTTTTTKKPTTITKKTTTQTTKKPTTTRTVQQWTMQTSKKQTVTTRTATTTRQAAEAPAGASSYQQEVLRLVNIEREKVGKKALSMDTTLTKAAQVRATEIVEYFSHTRPDGRTCFTAMQEAGVSYRAAGENIAEGYKTPAQVMDGWMNSPGHRENILKDSFGRLGVGYYVVNGRAYWVQMFAD